MVKKLLSFLLALTMLVSMLGFTAYADGKVLQSYSFESEDEGWTYYSAKDLSTNYLSKEKATQGSSALYIEDPGDGKVGGFRGEMIDVTPGTTYSISADAFIKASGTVFILRFYDSAKKKIEDLQVKAKKTNEWENLTGSKKAPEGSVYADIMIVTFSTGGGSGYFDNAKLYEGAAAPSTPTEAVTPSATTPSGAVETGDSEYKTEMEFLSTIGIIDSSFKWGAVLTKGEMTKLIAKVMHPDLDFSKVLSNAGPAFSDVSETHAYYPYIKACKDLGIVSGGYDNTFSPDKQITVIEAETMLINALGYTPYANAFGGYPTGYYTVATQTGIAKGIKASSSVTVTGEIAAKLIYNALFADLVELQSIKSGSLQVEIKNDKNLLSERLGIYQYDAIVVDNGISATEGSSMGDIEKAVIRDYKNGNLITAFVNGTDISSYLGFRVKAFIRNNMEKGKYEYIYASPYKQSDNITINAKTIINTTDTYIEYDEDESTSHFDKVSYNLFPSIIVNGIAVNDKTITEVIPEDGFVTFVENTGDSKYDLISVISFNIRNGAYNQPARNIIADNIVTKEDEESISCLFNPSDLLDLNEDEYSYTFAMNDKITGLSDVKAKDVISVAEAPEKVNGKTHYVLVGERNVKSGTFSSKSDNFVGLSDGSEYELSTSILNIKSGYINYLSLGKNVTLYLDKTGKIAYSETEGGSQKNYAYIVKAVERTQSGEKTIIVKLFTKDGKMEELSLAEKCKIDGGIYSDTNARLKAINKHYMDDDFLLARLDESREYGRPAIIDIKDGKITRIDTDYPNSDLSSGSLSEFYQTQTLIPYSFEDAESFDSLKAGFRNPRLTTPSGANKKVDGKFFVTGNTTVIAVPEIDTYGLSTDLRNKFAVSATTSVPNMDYVGLFELEGDEYYKVLKSSDIKSSNISYDIQGYDIDSDTGVAGLVIIRGRYNVKANYDYGSVYSVFSKKNTVYDAKKEKNVTKIYYYNESGVEQSALVDLEDAFYSIKYKVAGKPSGEGVTAHKSTVVEALEPGDLIRIKVTDGYVTTLDRMVNLSLYKDMWACNQSLDQATGTPYSGSTALIGEIRTSESTPIYDELLGLGYVKQIKGSIIRLAVPRDTKMSGIDMYDITKNTEIFVDTLSVQPLVIEISENGEITVNQGTYNDVITLNEADNSIDEASLMVYGAKDGKIVSVYIINGMENILN